MTIKKKPVSIKPERLPTSEQQAGFPIIAIGASAGGLEALEAFLSNVPADSDMAFVVIQHLDPTRKGMLVELLQRCTEMKVMQVKDRMRIEPNHVYIIPPNKDMSILHGVLHLLNPSAPRGLRLPIDFFFRALAEDREERSIGVVLSGMGADGTLGLRAIKEKAGAAFVQEPASSQFDSMPNSAINAGLADVIDTADALPGKIIAYLHHLPSIPKTEFITEHTSQSSLEKIVILLRNHTGHDFSLYKTATVYRRIARRMALHQISKIDDYVRFLQENPQERDFLFRELLIGVTGFFRDQQGWEQLETEVLPLLLSRRVEKQVLRAWIPACSTGEEAYSLAILFKEAVEKLMPTPNVTLQIFATDLDEYAITKAREGVFQGNIISEEVSEKQLERFFVKAENGYRVAKSIREMIIFAPQNIIMDPPFTKLDILCCRNLLIYLAPELQKKLIPTFHYCLKPGGFLFLGTAETIGNFTDLFTSLPGKNQVFQRRDIKLPTDLIEFPTNFTTAKHEIAAKVLKPKANLQTLADNLILQTYAPAGALTNSKGDILYISGHTGKYLEPAAGKANWNLFVMAREGLRYKLTTAFQDAVNKKETITLKNVLVGTNGGKQFVNVIIQPIAESESNALSGMVLIVFHDVSSPLRSRITGKPRLERAQIEALEQELVQARHEAQTVNTEMQKSQEELEISQRGVAVHQRRTAIGE